LKDLLLLYNCPELRGRVSHCDCQCHSHCQCECWTWCWTVGWLILRLDILIIY